MAAPPFVWIVTETNNDYYGDSDRYLDVAVSFIIARTIVLKHIAERVGPSFDAEKVGRRRVERHNGERMVLTYVFVYLDGFDDYVWDIFKQRVTTKRADED